MNRAVEIVDALLEVQSPRTMYKQMDRALERLNRMNPAGYAQLILTPGWPLPAHAEDDPNDPWWTSDEAAERLQHFKEAAEQGPKPLTAAEQYARSPKAVDAALHRADIEAQARGRRDAHLWGGEMD